MDLLAVTRPRFLGVDLGPVHVAAAGGILAQGSPCHTLVLEQQLPKNFLPGSQESGILYKNYLVFVISQAFTLHKMQLAVNDHRRDDKDDRNKELEDDETGAHQAPAATLKGTPRALEYFDGVKGGHKKSRIDPRCCSDQDCQHQRGYQRRVTKEFCKDDMLARERIKIRQNGQHQQKGKDHRESCQEDRFHEELDDQLPPTGTQHISEA